MFVLVKILVRIIYFFLCSAKLAQGYDLPSMDDVDLQTFDIQLENVRANTLISQHSRRRTPLISGHLNPRWCR